MIISKHTPASVVMTERTLLTGKGADHQTFHIVLSLKDLPISFKPGDSIGIYPENDPRLVEHLLNTLGRSGEEKILCPRTQEEMTLCYFLTHKANLARATSSFLKLFYAYEEKQEKKEELSSLLKRQDLSSYLKQADPLDLLKEYGGSHTPVQELCAQFGPLLPRFYSIASSRLLFPDEVHLTVALSSFSHAGEIRYGVASHFLCHLAKVNQTKIPLYVQPAPHFGLPEDHEDIIMVGPGTGVAPFRAFLQERLGRGAVGKNWLFFGERYREHSYFYKDFFETLQSEGFLKLSLAFSRDGGEKYYVQHAMKQAQKELWQWIEKGAYFFVCGDAHAMAKDVDAALVEIIQTEGKCSEQAARDYIKEMRKSHRYIADVY